MFRIIGILKNLSRPVAVVLLIAATFLVYWPALRNGFVWDDTALVLRDPLIRSWRLIPEGFRHFLFLDATASDFYRPIQRLTFTGDYALYGFGAPWGWHFTSIAIHAAAVVALFFLARMWTQKNNHLAFAASLLWAVHPLHTSAVTYVAGRADPLAALFGFSALALALRSLESPRSRLATFAAGVGFLCALLSKESGIFAMLVWFVVLAWRRAPLRVFGKWLAIAALVLALYLCLRSRADRFRPPAPAPTPVAVRPILAARAVAEYAVLLIYPHPRNLHMERDVTTIPQSTPEDTLRNARLREYQTLLGVLLVFGFAWWLRREWRRHSDTTLCLLACVVAYLPISNLFSLNATVAEHWLYVPSAFLILAWNLSLPRLREGRSPWIHVFAVIPLGFLFGGFTAIQQSYWHDQRTFFERTIARGGDTPRMHINLGNLESSSGNYDAAREHFRIATTRAPDLAIGWLGLATAATRARDFATAHAALEKMPPSPLLAADVLQARAVLEHLETGRDTADLLRQALDAAPRNWSIRKRHLEHLAERGETAAAARELSEFLSRESFRSESWMLLGTFLEKLAQPAAAATAYERAAALDMRDAKSRERLAALGARGH